MVEENNNEDVEGSDLDSKVDIDDSESNSCNQCEYIMNSNEMKMYIALQIVEVMEHKHYLWERKKKKMEEKLGNPVEDVSIEEVNINEALLNWNTEIIPELGITHAQRFRDAYMYDGHRENIRKMCDLLCPDGCQADEDKEFHRCVKLQNQNIHELLNDYDYDHAYVALKNAEMSEFRSYLENENLEKIEKETKSNLEDKLGEKLTDYQFYLTDVYAGITSEDYKISVTDIIRIWNTEVLEDGRTRSQRFHDNYFKHIEQVRGLCSNSCNGACLSKEDYFSVGCVLSINKIHEILEDWPDYYENKNKRKND